MLVTLASGFGLLIPVGARVGQKLPISIHTTTSGRSVGAERFLILFFCSELKVFSVFSCTTEDLDNG